MNDDLDWAEGFLEGILWFGSSWPAAIAGLLLIGLLIYEMVS